MDNRVTENPFASEAEKGAKNTGGVDKIREGLVRLLKGLGAEIPEEASDDDLAFAAGLFANYLETPAEKREPNQLEAIQAFAASSPEDSTTASIRKQFGISKIEWLRNGGK